MNDRTRDNEQSPVDTQVGGKPVTSIEVGGEARRDGSKPQARSSTEVGLTADIDADGINIHETDKKPVTVQKKPEGEAGDADGKTEGKETPGTETEKGADEGDKEAEALPEFKADNAEVVTAYDKAFLKDGAPDLNKLSQEWWKSAKRSEDGQWSGDLPAGVYDYLATKGFSKETVKGIEAGQIALQQQKESQVYSMAGGPDALKAALQWARTDKGYTQAQKDRYQAAIASNDMGAIEEQVTLLISRYSKATGQKTPGTASERRANPERTTTSGGGAGEGGGSEVKPYENYREYQADLRKARAENNQTLLNETRTRYAASSHMPWRGGTGKR